MAISLGITVLGLLARDRILAMFGAGPETMGYARQYITIILLGNVFQGIGFGLNNVIRAEGHARTAMFTMIVGATANALLDPLFIFVFGMGVAGAAVATVISMAITSTWVTAHFAGRGGGLRLRLANMRWERRIVAGIFSIGMAPFAMQLAGSVINALFNFQLIRHGGDLAVGAMGIINSVAMMIVFCVIAINMASQPVVGFNYGARQFKRVRRALKLAVVSATAVTTAGFLAVEIFPGPSSGSSTAATPGFGDRYPGHEDTPGRLSGGRVPGGQLQLLPGHRPGQDFHVPEPAAPGDRPHPAARHPAADSGHRRCLAGGAPGRPDGRGRDRGIDSQGDQKAG